MQSQQQENSRRWPELRINWLRYPDAETANIVRALTKTTAYTTFGGKGQAKSSLGEALASNYNSIIDLFGSRDNESLAWLRTPLGKKVLFLKGNSTKVDCNCADVANIVDFKLSMIDEYPVIISAPGFYSSIREEWICIAKLMDKFWNRESYSYPTCILIREGSSLLASRHLLGDDQNAAINYTIHMLREMRHCGFAIALDTIRWFGVDRDYRAVSDYTFIKAPGTEGLPDQLHFLYSFFDPSKVQRLAKDTFLVLSNEGAIGVGSFDEPYWHKKEGENMRALFDIHVEKGELPHYGGQLEDKVNDFEHVRIIKTRAETHEGMGKLGELLGRSSRTIHVHITRHNAMVASIGECDRCRRVNSPYAKQTLD